MRRKNKKVDFQIEQQSGDIAKGNEVAKVVLKNTFNLLIQLLPIWFMVALEILTNIKFNIQDYTSNILVFAMISSVGNIAGLSGQDYMDVWAEIIKYMLSIVLCFSLFFYILVLLEKTPGLEIKDMPILLVSIGLCILVFVAMFYQEIRRVNEKKCG